MNAGERVLYRLTKTADFQIEVKDETDIVWFKRHQPVKLFDMDVWK